MRGPVGDSPGVRASGGTPKRSTAGIDLVSLDTEWTLTSSAYEALKKAIVAMRIYDGDADLRLDERALASELGISRTPVREALVRLEQDGLVRTVPRRGVYVVRKTKREIVDTIIASAALEGMAARLAAERATDEALDKFRAQCPSSAGEASQMSLEAYSEMNLSFHQSLLELSDSPTIMHLVSSLQVHMRAIRDRTMGDADRMARSIAEHCEMVHALVRRDAAEAERLVRDHALHLARHVEQNVTYLD